MTPDANRHDSLIVEELCRALGDIVAVYRFGSSADGATHRGSDTDIAVLARQRLPHGVRFDIQERLASRLGHDVDLVDLAAASPVMAIQAVARGRLLYDGGQCCARELRRPDVRRIRATQRGTSRHPRTHHRRRFGLWPMTFRS